MVKLQMLDLDPNIQDIKGKTSKPKDVGVVTKNYVFYALRRHGEDCNSL